MQTLRVIQRLPAKGMVNRFKSNTIWSLCSSFSPLLLSQSICWLFLNLWSLISVSFPYLWIPLSFTFWLHFCVSSLSLPFLCFHSCFAAFSSCVIFLSSLLIREPISHFLHPYLLWYLPSFYRIFPLISLLIFSALCLPHTALSPQPAWWTNLLKHLKWKWSQSK